MKEFNCNICHVKCKLLIENGAREPKSCPIDRGNCNWEWQSENLEPVQSANEELKDEMKERKIGRASCRERV